MLTSNFKPWMCRTGDNGEEFETFSSLDALAHRGDEFRAKRRQAGDGSEKQKKERRPVHGATNRIASMESNQIINRIVHFLVAWIIDRRNQSFLIQEGNRVFPLETVVENYGGQSKRCGYPPQNRNILNFLNN